TARIGEVALLSPETRRGTGVGTTALGNRGSSAGTELDSLIRAGLGDIRVLLYRSIWGLRQTRFVVEELTKRTAGASNIPRDTTLDAAHTITGSEVGSRPLWLSSNAGH